MLRIAVSLMYKYGINFENRCHVFVDGANPEFIRALKDRLGEDANYDGLIIHLKTSYGKNFGLPALMENMCVIPINFRNEHKQMLLHAKRILEILRVSYPSAIISAEEIIQEQVATVQRSTVELSDLVDMISV
jgi:hypothetical protein